MLGRFTQQLAKTSVGVLVGMGVAFCLLPKPSLAQTTDANPLADFQNQENRDLFSNKDSGDSFSVFDLIHRAQLGTIRDANEYSSEQRQNLNDAAADFRRQQLQRLRSSPSPVTNQNNAPAQK